MMGAKSNRIWIALSLQSRINHDVRTRRLSAPELDVCVVLLSSSIPYLLYLRKVCSA